MNPIITDNSWIASACVKELQIPARKTIKQSMKAAFPAKEAEKRNPPKYGFIKILTPNVHFSI
ncbi:MAG: hypothetical protein LBU32_10325 [Clostridiales bacterium]|jgi:hypothetical protein|nr:hypothetical protein [Clostridiales bacterium]